MAKIPEWLRDHRMWIELYALFNLAGMAPDIVLAHSVNSFHHAAEYVPLIFSAIVPVILFPAVWGLAHSERTLWRVPGYIVGWTSILIGITGLLLHLKSQFFQQWTMASLVYAAPFAAPLAYTGVGLLLVMNRMVDSRGAEWPLWVIFLALGGFVGNFIFSVTDHAQNGFYHFTEWLPVGSSALAVGFLVVPLLLRVSREYLRLCGAVMAVQAAIGVLGFVFHAHADWHGAGATLFDRVVYGAPIFAPMLFPDLVILAGIGLWVFNQQLPKRAAVSVLRS